MEKKYDPRIELVNEYWIKGNYRNIDKLVEGLQEKSVYTVLKVRNLFRDMSIDVLFACEQDDKDILQFIVELKDKFDELVKLIISKGEK